MVYNYCESVGGGRRAVILKENLFGNRRVSVSTRISSLNNSLEFSTVNLIKNNIGRTTGIFKREKKRKEIYIILDSSQLVT